MLRAIRRVLRPGGALAFLSIHPAPGLDAVERRRAIRAGPPGVALRSSHESLLASARFVDVEAYDVTAAYRETQHGWIRAYQRNQDGLRALFGDDEFDDRMHRRHRSLAAIDAGILRRSFYLATAGGGARGSTGDGT